jgi:heme oxygenase
MSAIAELRAATWPSHQRLEKRLDIKQRFGSLPCYREHLQRMYGFCAGIEQRVPAESLHDALSDYPQRRKLPLLEQDLRAIGIASETVADLPYCEALPACHQTAAALGCLYVIEGATLGGRTLLPMVQKQLGLTAQSGAAFLASYGPGVDLMWHRFGNALDAWCTAPERSAFAAQAAVATFQALETWLCGDTA